MVLSQVIQKNLKLIHDELMNKNDEYFLLADFESYANAQRQCCRIISRYVLNGLEFA